MFGKPGLLAMLDMNLDMGAASMSSAVLKGCSRQQHLDDHRRSALPATAPRPVDNKVAHRVLSVLQAALVRKAPDPLQHPALRTLVKGYSKHYSNNYS